MNEHIKEIIEARLEETVKHLQEHNFDTYICENKKDVLSLLNQLIDDDSKVSHGGSVTLAECGIYDYLRKRKITFYEHNDPSLSREEFDKCIRESFYADTYLMSTSAITKDGELYNIDGSGNRLASLIFGPKQVLIIAGINKLVTDLDAAVDRVKTISAPANAHRLNCATPCAKVGYCMDCRSQERICCHEVVTSWQRIPHRIKIIIVKEELGY